MKKGYTRRVPRVLERVMPGLQVARTYQWRWLRADVFAGLTIFALLVPQGMAYGETGRFLSMLRLCSRDTSVREHRPHVTAM